MRCSVLAAVVAVCFSMTGAACAQHLPTAAAEAPATPIDAAARRQVLETLARELDGKFVFPEVGARYAAMLRANLASGRYDAAATREALGETVTADLQALHKDGHLRLAPEAAFNRPRPASGAPASAPPPAMEPPRMIGEVAYLKFNVFSGDPALIEQARSFLVANANAKAVIIDARTHRGGGLAEMDALLPFLFGQKATLVRMDTRAGIPTPLQPGDTLLRRASPASVVRVDHVVTPDVAARGLQNVPVFYLTSKRTASAAEHLALAFKRTKRAVLVGETTRGAGHYGGLYPVGSGMMVFLPVGRSYDPQTGEGWEGSGVKPDVETPADHALDEALKRAAAAGARIA